MKIRRAAILLAATLLGCAPGTQEPSNNVPGSTDTTTGTVPDTPPPTTGAPTDTTAHVTGFGPVRAGMTVAEAERALGTSLVLLGPRMEPCHYVLDEKRPGVAYMIIDGRVARADIRRGSTIRTAEGAGIGDTEERIQALYPGRVEVQPHKYVDGHYLIVRSPAPADTIHRMIFETDGKKVTSYRTGRLPEVRWVEGCS